MKKLYYLLVLSPIFVFAQPTVTENYIKTTTYKLPTTTVPTPTDAQKVQDINYYDGLGRPKQQIAYGQSGTGKNIVIHTEYDLYGRQPKQYLPYVPTTVASQGIHTSALADLTSYYGTPTFARTGNPNCEATNNPYNEKQFETSPLNRVLQLAAAGNDWLMSSNKTLKTVYQTNVLNEVKLYVAIATNTNYAATGYYATTLSQTSNYAINQLYKTITKNENWVATDLKNNTTEEFKDKYGNIVLKRTYDSSDPHDTYYVYDQYNNLSFVLPPLVTNSNDPLEMEQLCYQYRYDNRNRLVEKKLPGKQWEFVVYDKLDRVVATGPTFSPFATDLTPNNIGWMVTKYDGYNRPIITGWMPSTTVTSVDRKTLQNNRNLDTVLNETKAGAVITINGVGIRYTNTAFPASSSSYHVLTINYYDDYNTNITFAPVIAYTTSVSPQPAYYNNTVGTQPKGLATISWVRIPESRTLYKAETSYIIYDNKARAVRSFVNNYIGGFTQVDTQMETMTGRVNYTLTTHKRVAASPTISVRDNYSYTPQDRMLAHTHQINGGSVQLLAENSYDELGQLISKKVGNTSATPLQKVDYSYTARGWLKSINDINNLTQGTDPQDLFAYKINYNTIEDGTSYGGKALYNGNIAETYWRSSSDNVLRKYGYKYDHLNRLKNSIYQKPSLSPSAVTNSYNESMDYDKNSNIIHLQRNGEYDDAVMSLQTDNLTYAYANSNKSNRLMKVTDTTNNTNGFKDDSTGYNDTVDDYSYDANGNLTADQNKAISLIRYNQLNLPLEIIFVPATKKINYLYNSNGQKVKKTITVGTLIKQTDYLDGYQYTDGVLNFFPTAEGYVQNTVVAGANTYNYVYNYSDHIGNVRLSYSKDAVLNTLQILEESHYYAFGLKHKGYNMTKMDYSLQGFIKVCSTCPEKYKYKYNGKEYQDELGLNMYDYGARNYDPAIGRWSSIDPLAETSRRYSPYVYALNNPVYFIDPDGMQADNPESKPSEEEEEGEEGGSTASISETVASSVNASVNASINQSVNDSVNQETPPDTYKLEDNGQINKIDDHKYYDENGVEVDKLITGNPEYDANGNLTNANISVSKGILDSKSDLSKPDENGKEVKGYSLNFGNKIAEARNFLAFVTSKSSVEYTFLNASSPENISINRSLIFTSFTKEKEYFGFGPANNFARIGWLNEHTHSHPSYNYPEASDADYQVKSSILNTIDQSKIERPDKLFNQPKFNVYHGGQYNPY
jgi:RHS repeat-associated protein